MSVKILASLALRQEAGETVANKEIRRLFYKQIPHVLSTAGLLKPVKSNIGLLRAKRKKRQNNLWIYGIPGL